MLWWTLVLGAIVFAVGLFLLWRRTSRRVDRHDEDLRELGNRQAATDEKVREIQGRVHTIQSDLRAVTRGASES